MSSIGFINQEGLSLKLGLCPNSTASVNPGDTDFFFKVSVFCSIIQRIH